ncbi:hypothetical protein [Bradyrhizobium sp. WSM3983]|nr:hypothetical protein [Bradyrhizobium sp. WSM3983]
MHAALAAHVSIAPSVSPLLDLDRDRRNHVATACRLGSLVIEVSMS